MLRPRSASSPGPQPSGEPSGPPGLRHSYDPRTYTGPNVGGVDPGQITFVEVARSTSAPVKQLSASTIKADFSMDVMAHNHDTVESELNVLFVTTSLAVILGYSIPATFSREEYFNYVSECNAVLASNDTALIKESEWCVSAEKYIWATSYGTTVLASASFLLTMFIYMPWRLVRPSPHDIRSSEQFYHVYRWMFTWSWGFLTLSYGLMGWTTALLFQLKFEFKRQVYMTTSSYLLQVFTAGCAIWSYRRYRELLLSMENMIAWKRTDGERKQLLKDNGGTQSGSCFPGFKRPPKHPEVPAGHVFGPTNGAAAGEFGFGVSM